ncbi:MAG: YdcF family protein [Caulobacterales bacterium]|nr:YdcF family protein [Caulobacterales bacterium]
MKYLAAIGVILMIWLAGLLAFADRIEMMTPAVDPGRADGIVVLTGASDARINEALRLLAAGRGERLLVSGVNRQVQRGELREVTAGSNRLFDCCVDLGFEAEDTVGNAQEIAAWAAAKHYDSLIVVTSDYHMPRAMLEIRGLMRHVELIAFPVITPSLNADSWWRTGTGQRRMVVEYSKYLAVLLREAFARIVRPSPEPAADTGAEPSERNRDA